MTLRRAALGVGCALALGWAGPGQAAPRQRPVVSPFHEPEPVTAAAEPVGTYAVSADGRWLAYSTGRGHFRDLWLRSADPNVVVLPHRLTTDPGDEHSPAFSPDGRWLAYVGTGYDAKGDLYLLELQDDTPPVRLTGRETADGGPRFEPDGRGLLFHATAPGGEPRLAALRLGPEGAPAGSPRELDTAGPAQDPAPAPDGRRVAFVSFRDDPGGDLFVLDRETGAVTPLTWGPARDESPAWAPDGSALWFARREVDTDGDGALTAADRPVAALLDPANPAAGVHPRTAASWWAEQPQLAAPEGRPSLYVLSDRGGVANVWLLPAAGEVPDRPTAPEQLALAGESAAQVPAAPLRTALAYARVRERFPAPPETAVRAAFALAETYRQAGYPAAAANAYRAARDSSATAPVPVLPEEALARVFLARLDGAAAWERAPSAGERAARSAEVLAALQQVAREVPRQPRVQARAELEQAHWLLDRGDGLAAVLEAARRLDQVAAATNTPADLAAEALLLRADALARAGDAAGVVPAYRRVLESYPEEDAAANSASRKLLALALEAAQGTEDQVRFLLQLAADNRRDLPRLAAAALNRSGDLLYNAEEWARAKSAYRQVLDEFPRQTTQRVAARLALAGVLVREERFRQALDLYENELAEHPVEDRLYRLARAGYLRQSVAAAEFLFTTGEVVSAQGLFRDLARYDDRVVEAHRGIIRCAAALGNLAPVLAEYRQRAAAAPDDPLLQYAVGLALTYREDHPSLEEARQWLQRAIAGQGRVEYFHQTLGYVEEVLETVHGEKGLLERAAESYRRAAFLNDPDANPDNAANLLLNLGNAYFLLGQNDLAFRQYRDRLRSGVAFSNPETEILFYRRLAGAAFQVHEPEVTVTALEKALELLRANADPLRASRLYDTLVQQVQQQYLAPPPGGVPLPPDTAERAERQSALRAEVFALSAAPPTRVPSPEWEAYLAGMLALLPRQAALNAQLLAAAGAAEPARQGLELHLTRIRQALEAPLRFAELEAELLDRLGLAYQEAARWDDAAATFDAVFEHNRQLGNTGNLAQNKRSAAYNRYQGAAATSGAERTARLRRAARDFQEVLTLVAAHGVAAHEVAADTPGLIAVGVQVPLAAGNATQAAFGFSAAQEQRLAEGYLARIALELGELDDAEARLAAQLAPYSNLTAVPEGDRYGVSLLAHRAGLLAFARGDPGVAFDRFGDSARLSAALGNAASTALNVADMARALVAGRDRGATTPARLATFEQLDRRATALVSAAPALAKTPAAGFFHTALGVHWLELADRTGPGVEGAVRRVRALQRAAAHFAAGLDTLPAAPATRTELAAAARLSLGAARVATDLGDSPGRTAAALERALEFSRRGHLPDLEWRALAGQGQLEAALAVLRVTPVWRAHAAPGEILRVFSPLVTQLLDAQEVEPALDLMEELAEVERVQRLAPLLLGPLTPADRALVARLLPRLQRLRGLDEELRTATGEARAPLAEAEQRERKLLAETLGAERQRVPDLARTLGSAAEQDTLLLLLGLAQEAEARADATVAAPTPERRAALDADAEAAQAQFMALLAETLDALAPDQPLGLWGALAPRPATAVELVEALPEGTALVRVWHRPGAAEPAPWLALVLTADGVEPFAAATPRDLWQQASTWAAAEGGLTLAVAGEEPAQFQEVPAGTPLALSGTHWLRSSLLQRPLRHSLLVLPGPQGLPQDALPGEGTYRLLRTVQDPAQDPTDPRAAVWELLPLAHTLVATGPVLLGGGVPTRAAESGAPTAVVPLAGGVPLPLSSLLGELPRTGLAAFPQLGPELWFEAGHLLTLAGVPTIAVPRPHSAADLGALLARYASQAAAESAAATGWLLLGSPGLTPAQAAAIAEQQFAGFAQTAQAAFAAGRFPEAAATLEDALLLAEETPALERHLPALHRFAREAAFAAGDLPRAAEHAAALVAHWERTRPDGEEHADATLRLGLVLARQEHFDQALPALESAVEMLANLEQPAEAAAALTQLGVVQENATEYDRALQSFGTAAELGTDLDRDDLVAAQQMHLGRLYDLRLSRWAQAKRHYLAALELYDATGDLPGVIQALLDTGRCERLLGNFPAAAARYGQARELLADEPDPILEAKVVMEQANNAWFQGRYQEAFELQQQVLATARAENWPLGQVLARNTAGLTWWTLGDNDRALRELHTALERAEALPGRADEVATSWNNIGLVQREQGHYDDALEALNRALAIDRRLRSRWAIAYDLRNLGLTLLRRGDTAAALPPLQEASAEATAIGDQVNAAKARLALAEARWAQGEAAVATELYQQALDLSRAMTLRETEWRALYGLARIRLAAGDGDAARKLLFAAVEVVENLRAAIKLEQLRDGFLTNKLDVYQLLVQVLVDQGDTAGAFTVAERSRSRNFIDLLGTQRLTLHGAVEQEAYEHQQALRARREETEALLAQAQTDGERVAYQKALAALDDEQTDLRLTIQTTHPELASLISVEPISAAQVRSLLEPGVSLLAYYLLPHEVLCWVLQADRLTLVRTPVNRKALQQEIFAYRRLVQNLEPLDAASHALYAQLLAPVLPELAGTRTLGLIPHGPLHYLSFATLGDENGYLVDRYPLFYLPSASVMRYTLERRQREPNRSVLAIGNPDLGAVSLQLPFAEQEVDSIHWNFPQVTVLTGKRATKSWVVRHLGEFGIIHLASHGEFDPVNPLFSALKLARGEDTDGDLRAAEVFGLELNADLVVLSACQTGVGKVTGGDDVIGLNRAFFYAGTHAIASSLWRVSDVSTAVLMKQFYRQLGEGRSKAESLRSAMLHVKNRYPHPGYWGAFALSGDYL